MTLLGCKREEKRHPLGNIIVAQVIKSWKRMIDKHISAAFSPYVFIFKKIRVSYTFFRYFALYRKTWAIYSNRIVLSWAFRAPNSHILLVHNTIEPKNAFTREIMRDKNQAHATECV